MLVPPLFSHLCFQYFTRKILCALNLAVSVNLCFSISCRIARKIFRTKEVTGKIFRNKDLPDGHVVSAVNLRVLKDRVPRPEHRTGGAGDWLPRSQSTVRSELDR